MWSRHNSFLSTTILNEKGEWGGGGDGGGGGGSRRSGWNRGSPRSLSAFQALLVLEHNIKKNRRLTFVSEVQPPSSLVLGPSARRS